MGNTGIPDWGLVSVFRQVPNKWLVDGEGSPFNMIHKLMRYGMRGWRKCGGEI